MSDRNKNGSGKKKPVSAGNNASTVNQSWLKHPLVIKTGVVLILVFIAWLIYLDAQVRYKFEGKRWALPAQVYARALEVYDGRALNMDNLENELALLNYQRVDQPSRPGDYSVRGAQVELVSRAHDLPDGTHLSRHFRFSIRGDVVQNLTAVDGQNASIVTLEPFKMGGIYPHVKEERLLVSYDELPESLILALLVTEDRDFFSHWGVAPLSIARAMVANIRAGRVVQGGSTLTQQLVKNFYLSRERSIWRKLNEAFMALLLEVHYSKEAILETYANDIFLGQAGKTAIHGFAMASRFYFGKDLSQCSVGEVATLVAMLKGPSYFDPRRFPERTTERRNLILKLLYDVDFLSMAELQTAQGSPLNVVRKPSLQTNRYPAFMDLVKRQLKQEYHEDDLRTEGLRIYTTLDPQVQREVERAVKEKLPQVSKDPSLQAAAVVTGVGTGEVLAMVGDRRTRYEGFNRALDAERQIGSLIKPAVYLTALRQPDKYHLATPLSDEAFRLEFENGQSWQPDNFDHEVHGTLPLYQSLAKSYNLSTARLGLELGVEQVQETLRLLGIEKPTTPYPSLFLGAQSLTPFEVSKFYQTIASNGFNMPLRGIREVTNAQGELLSRYPFETEQVIEPEAIFLLQHAMQEVMRSGTGKSAYWTLPSALKTAGKTGTTNDNRDSWFAGFSGDYLGIVWLGKDDNSPTTLTGSSGALKVWTQFISRIPQYPIASRKPKAVDYHWYHETDQVLTDERCRGAVPLPIWGEPAGLEYASCRRGVGAIKEWFKSWF